MITSDLAYELDDHGESVLREDFATRRGYRLPTAREWIAIWDDDKARTACVMDDSLVEFFAQILPYSNRVPAAVGVTKPDRNGLFHMAGNAEEWCSDRLGPNRAIRGIHFSWGLNERSMITEAHWTPAEINWIRIGFRVARSTGRASAADTPTSKGKDGASSDTK